MAKLMSVLKEPVKAKLEHMTILICNTKLPPLSQWEQFLSGVNSVLEAAESVQASYSVVVVSPWLR